nr:aminotransferase class III-fold pyridoxal phosphate-dependent enzyme [Pseudoteredinibacter isoporae]
MIGDAYYFYENPFHPVRAEGVWMYDAQGRRYLDCYNNVPSVGHCNPRVVEAISTQAAKLNTHTRYLDETILDYAEKLSATFDDQLNSATFTCTGTESNEIALRLARKYTGGMGIICSSFTYHGNSTAVWELATFNGEPPSSPNVKAVPFPDSYRPEFEGSDEELAEAYANEVQKAIEAFEKEGVKFAGLLFCPIFSAEGLPDVPATYLKKAVEKVRSAGGLFICDEVQAGFARTGGHMWGHQIHGVTPDIVTLGKPMGNGHPIGGVITTKKLLDHFHANVMYFNTFGGNAVSCSAGLAVLEVIEQENLMQNAASVGEYARAELLKLQERHEIIGDVRGHGLFMALDLVKDRGTKEPATDETTQLVNEMYKRGVLINRVGVGDNILKMRPPLVFNKENVDQLVSTLDDVLTII